MRVLGIETSCDETGVAVYDTDRGLTAHELYSQVRLHAEFGGVVPELASRDHIRKLCPLIRRALEDSGAGDVPPVDGVVYTAGPGLAGALLVGAGLASSLAYAWEVPLLGIHHMEGHLLAPMLETRAPEFPFIALLVSGGHTMLVNVAGLGRYEILGETLDDAAGEAFDKTAKVLGLSYPGGPALARLARDGEAGRFRLPRPMLNRPGLEFSFSGLKTAVIVLLRQLRAEKEIDDQTRADIARAFQDAVVDTLAEKSVRALKQTGSGSLVVAGGVGANERLRKILDERVTGLGGRVYYPRPEFCTDNGAMIAYAGSLRLAAGETQPAGFDIDPRWRLDALASPAAGEKT